MTSTRTHRDIIVIGASTGGIETLQTIVADLPADFPAAVLVVQHIASTSRNLLPQILSRCGDLPAKTPRDGEPIRMGQIYVAPANAHMLVDGDQLQLSRGPRENRARPAIDPLFRSAALHHGPRVIGIVLSGALDDGTAGLWAIKQSGGLTVVQDPSDAIQPDMPRNALDHVDVDHTVPARLIGPLLGELVRIEAPIRASVPHLVTETEIQQHESGTIDQIERMGQLVPMSCPECGGPLWKMEGQPLPRYRCHTGHAFTGVSLAEGLSEASEMALWVALRTLDERTRMLERLTADHEGLGRTRAASSFRERAEEVKHHASSIRQLLTAVSDDPPREPVSSDPPREPVSDDPPREPVSDDPPREPVSDPPRKRVSGGP